MIARNWQKWNRNWRQLWKSDRYLQLLRVREPAEEAGLPDALDAVVVDAHPRYVHGHILRYIRQLIEAAADGLRLGERGARAVDGGAVARAASRTRLVGYNVALAGQLAALALFRA